MTPVRFFGSAALMPMIVPAADYDRQPKYSGNFFSIRKRFHCGIHVFQYLIDAVYVFCIGKFIPFPKEIIGIWDIDWVKLSKEIRFFI